MALVGILIGDLAHQLRQPVENVSPDLKQVSPHCYASSPVRREITNGDSTTLRSRAPLRIPYQSRSESISTMATKTIKTPQTAASRRALKIRACVWLMAVPA